MPALWHSSQSPALVALRAVLVILGIDLIFAAVKVEFTVGGPQVDGSFGDVLDVIRALGHAAAVGIKTGGDRQLGWAIYIPIILRADISGQSRKIAGQSDQILNGVKLIPIMHSTASFSRCCNDCSINGRKY